jgi:hypothetical protein
MKKVAIRIYRLMPGMLSFNGFLPTLGPLESFAVLVLSVVLRETYGLGILQV